MGLRGQDGLEPGPGIATPDAVDLAGRARPEHFERGAVVFAGGHGEADIAEKFLVVECERLPLGANFVGEFGNPVVEARHGDAAVFVMQRGDDLREHPDRVHRGPAVHAGMQIPVRAGDGDLLAEQARAASW